MHGICGDLVTRAYLFSVNLKKNSLFAVLFQENENLCVWLQAADVSVTTHLIIKSISKTLETVVNVNVIRWKLKVKPLKILLVSLFESAHKKSI